MASAKSAGSGSVMASPLSILHSPLSSLLSLTTLHSLGALTGSCSGQRLSIDPNVWRGGATRVAKADHRCSDGFNMLRPFPDDSRLLCAGHVTSKCHVTIYSSDATEIGVLKGHETEVRSVAIDDKHIASGDSRGGIRLWKIRSLEAVGEPLPIEHGGRIFGLQIEGDVLLSGAADKTAKVWSVSGRTCTATLLEHSHYVFCVDFTEAAIATASHDGMVRRFRQIAPDAQCITAACTLDSAL